MGSHLGKIISSLLYRKFACMWVTIIVLAEYGGKSVHCVYTTVLQRELKAAVHLS